MSCARLTLCVHGRIAIGAEEQKELVRELEDVFKGKRYSFVEHWDQVITGYRELERSLFKFSIENQRTLKRLSEAIVSNHPLLLIVGRRRVELSGHSLLQGSEVKLFPHVHVLDIHEVLAFAYLLLVSEPKWCLVSCDHAGWGNEATRGQRQVLRRRSSWTQLTFTLRVRVAPRKESRKSASPAGTRHLLHPAVIALYLPCLVGDLTYTSNF